MIFRADIVTPAVSATYNGAGFHHPAKRQGFPNFPSLTRRRQPWRPRNPPLLILRPLLVIIACIHCFSCPPDVHGGFFFLPNLHLTPIYRGETHFLPLEKFFKLPPLHAAKFFAIMMASTGDGLPKTSERKERPNEHQRNLHHA